jgi:hypothetical protein
MTSSTQQVWWLSISAAHSIRRFANPRLLVLLLSADCAFLLLHVLNGWSASPNDLFWLGTDGGYAEVFQYIKEASIAVMLVTVAWRTRAGIYAAWALLFAYLLCDDALRIHESVGESIVAYWGFVPTLGLSAGVWGELAVSATAGTALVAMIAYGHFRSGKENRAASRHVAVLLAILVFFGVFVDMVHVAIKMLVPLKGLTMIEDGGEMVAMSLIVSYVAQLLYQTRHRPERVLT